MISKEEFVKTLEEYTKVDKYMDALIHLNIDLVETPLFEGIGNMLDIIIKTNFDPVQEEIIYLYMFDGKSRELDTNNGKITSSEELYDYVCSLKAE